MLPVDTLKDTKVVTNSWTDSLSGILDKVGAVVAGVGTTVDAIQAKNEEKLQQAYAAAQEAQYSSQNQGQGVSNAPASSLPPVARYAIYGVVGLVALAAIKQVMK